MFDLEKIRKQFAEDCTACGLCIEHCPIVGYTELKDAAPEQIMEDILDLFRNKNVSTLARERIYSCLTCNTCISSCPVALSPSLAFGIGKAILQESGDEVPAGISNILDTVPEVLNMSISNYRQQREDTSWLITEPIGEVVKPVKTILFSSCFALLDLPILNTTHKILQHIDPEVKVMGGFDYCCGELQFISGKYKAAKQQFEKFINTLSVFSPERVVIFCPTCNMNIDRRDPNVSWTWHFITDFVADHLDELGTLNQVDATVTIHDPCHFARGEKTPSASPRKILNAIPGIKIIEMENNKEETMCCGAYATGASGEPGIKFKNDRLKQAADTGADIMGLYCPGCQMALGPEAQNFSLQIESILTVLGRSLEN